MMRDEKPMKPRWWRWSMRSYNLFTAILMVSVYAVVGWDYYVGLLNTWMLIPILFAVSIYPVYYYLRYFRGLHFLDYFMLGIGLAAPPSFILYLALRPYIPAPEVVVYLMPFVLGIPLGYIIGKRRKWKPNKPIFY